MARERETKGYQIKVDIDEAWIKKMVQQEVDDMGLEAVAEEVKSMARASRAFEDYRRKLRPSIKVKKSKFPDGGKLVKARAPHAHLVEYGHRVVNAGGDTGKMAPEHSFLRAAKEQVEPRAEEIVAKALAGLRIYLGKP